MTGVWKDLETAQNAVNEAMKKWLTGGSPAQNKKNQDRLAKWMRETPKDSESPTDLLSFDGLHGVHLVPQGCEAVR
ncbi:hypothetical protein [Streptomyces sp. NPDC001388]|uniref:hypothetical protein n=1 Tax=Streptomyces sp. NPDC001388 TaxID=3364568 RepID=UPI0036BF2069